MVRICLPVGRRLLGASATHLHLVVCKVPPSAGEPERPDVLAASDLDWSEDPISSLRRFGTALLKGNPDMPEDTFKTMLYDEATALGGAAVALPQRGITELAVELLKAAEPNLLTPVSESRPPQ